MTTTRTAAPLDRQVAAAREHDAQPWGVWPWLGPLLTTAALFAFARLVVAATAPGSTTTRTAPALVASTAAELVLFLAGVAFGHAVARRAGGWTAAFGLDRVRAIDWRPWIIGVGATFVGRLVVATLAAAATNGAAVRQAQNIHFASTSPVAITALVILTVVAAPVVEEFVFRGLLLRTFMRRMTFWPAACLSTAIFAAFHALEVGTIAGALTLAGAVTVLGLTNCVLVRMTGRLAPGMLVHATFNLAGSLVLIYRATH